MFGANPLGFEASNPTFRPPIDLVVDPLPAHGVVPSRACAAEVGSRVEDARPGLLTTIDPCPQGAHAVRVVFAGGECGRHPVRQVDGRLCAELLCAGLPGQGHAVVRVQVEETWKQDVVIVQLDQAGLGSSQVERVADRHDLPGSDDDSRVGYDGRTRAVEQRATTDHSGFLPRRERHARRRPEDDHQECVPHGASRGEKTVACHGSPYS